MAAKRFQRQLHVLVTPELQEMLDALAAREHMSPSEMVRALIHRAHLATVGAAAPAARARTTGEVTHQPTELQRAYVRKIVGAKAPSSKRRK